MKSFRYVAVTLTALCLARIAGAAVPPSKASSAAPVPGLHVPVDAVSGVVAHNGTPVSVPGSVSSSALCAVVACNSAQPVITKVAPLSTPTPGGAVLVRGTGFNAQNGTGGKLTLILGNPSSITRSEFPLDRLKWADSAVYGEIPQAIGGVVSQQGFLLIRRSDGMESNPIGVSFTAASSVANLPLSQIKTNECSKAADQNQCNYWADHSPADPVPDPLPFPTTASYGVHSSYLGSTSGEDRYSFALKNGWAVAESGSQPNIKIYPSRICGGDQASLVQVLSSGAGGSYTVAWSSECRVSYVVLINITGPQGVPY